MCHSLMMQKCTITNRRRTYVIYLEQQLQTCRLSCGKVQDVVSASVQNVQGRACKVCLGGVLYVCYLHQTGHKLHT